MPSDTASPARGHACLEVRTTRQTEFLDLTERLESLVADACVRNGVLHVATRHTTTGLLVNEAEPLLWQDLERMMSRLAPSGDLYAHDDFSRRTVNLLPDERLNGFAHCRAALLRSSETLIVRDGRLSLGRWQRVLFAEFDGPQHREVDVMVLPAG